MKYSVKIISALASSKEEMANVQKKLNQWNTTGLLKKYDIYTTDSHVVFNICIVKEA